MSDKIIEKYLMLSPEQKEIINGMINNMKQGE
jgi:hypothetical protein